MKEIKGLVGCLIVNIIIIVGMYVPLVSYVPVIFYSLCLIAMFGMFAFTYYHIKDENNKKDLLQSFQGISFRSLLVDHMVGNIGFIITLIMLLYSSSYVAFTIAFLLVSMSSGYLYYLKQMAVDDNE